jgi:predicted transcriptional regulator
MKRNVAVAVLVAVVLLLCSITLMTQTETLFTPFHNQIDTTQHYALAAPLVIGISSQPHNELNQTTRAEIFCLVQNNPGIHFRGVCGSLGLSIGMVQYHVGVLAAAGFLSVYSDGKMQRFFESGKYSKNQMKVISLLRHKTTRNILKIIIEEGKISHRELAAKLSITSQGLTWQMHRLQKTEVVEATNSGLKLTYSISKIEAFKEIIRTWA